MSTQEQAICKPAVFPYFAEKESFPPDILALIYRRLKEQDLLADLVHEKAISEEEFVAFVDRETIPYIFMDLSGKGECVGLAWITESCETECGQKRGVGSFVFFREFHDTQLTKTFGIMFLSHIYNILGYSQVMGLTPASNKPAIRYCKRVGFQYLSEAIPGYTCHRGEISDALVCYQTRDHFNQMLEDLHLG